MFHSAALGRAHRLSYSHRKVVTCILIILLTIIGSNCLCHIDAGDTGRDDTTLRDVLSQYLNVMVEKPVLKLLAGDSSEFLIQKAAAEYSLFHDDIDISAVIFNPSNTTSAPRLAWESLRRGEGDVALIPFAPTEAEKEATPDLLYLPFWATGFGPIFNVPEANGQSIVLNLLLIARIFTGNVTRWNDPLIRILNPDLTLPNQPIHIVLHSEPRSYIRQFTSIIGDHDAYFRSLIPISNLPTWPTGTYASYHYESGFSGPSSYVASHPYSISIALLSIATRMGVSVISIRNDHGVVVPTFSSITFGFNERVVVSSIDSSGAIAYSFSADQTAATGPGAWPLLSSVSLIVPKVFTVRSCVQRSELVKFLRWMYRSPSVRSTMAASDWSTFVTDAVNSQLELESSLINLRCEGEKIADGASDPMTIGGVEPATSHINIKDLLVNSYSLNDRFSSFTFTSLDEGYAMSQFVQLGQLPDLLWYQPITFDRLYPDIAQQNLGLTQTIHLGIGGVVPQHHLPKEVSNYMKPYFPLVLDIETMASIFLGDITSWLDSAITARNPKLIPAFASAPHVSPNITLVLCSSGLIADASMMSIGNHFILVLNETQAFKNSELTFRLPVDWSGVQAKLTAKGVKFVTVELEVQMELAIQNFEGAIGYALGFGSITYTDKEFQFAKKIVSLGGATSEYIVAPTSDSFLNVARYATPTEDASFALESALSTSVRHAGAWVFPLMISIGVMQDVIPTTAVTMTAETICSRTFRAIKFIEWIIGNENLYEVNQRAGRAVIAELPEWKTFFDSLLYACTCHGEPLNWVRPVIWDIPDSVIYMSRVGGSIGLALTLITIGLLCYFRRRTILRTADFFLQLTSLVGMVLIFVATIYFSLERTTEFCNALGWLLFLGLPLAFGPLHAKVLRVYYINSKSRGLKVLKISNLKLQVAVALWFIIHVVLTIIGDSEGGSILSSHTFIKFESDNRDHHYTECYPSSNATPWVVALLALNGLAIIATTLFALGIRRVSSAFNESRNITWVFFNTTIASIIVLVLVIFVTSMQGNEGEFLILFLVLWIACVMLIFTFGWKFSALFIEEWDIYRQAQSQGTSFTSFTSNHSTGTGSGTSGASYTSAILTMPSLDSVPLNVIEKYLTALETQLRLARARRRELVGTDSNRSAKHSRDSIVDETPILQMTRTTTRGSANLNGNTKNTNGGLNIILDKNTHSPNPNPSASPSSKQSSTIHTTNIAASPANPRQQLRIRSVNNNATISTPTGITPSSSSTVTADTPTLN